MIIEIRDNQTNSDCRSDTTHQLSRFKVKEFAKLKLVFRCVFVSRLSLLSRLSKVKFHCEVGAVWPAWWRWSI